MTVISSRIHSTMSMLRVYVRVSYVLPIPMLRLTALGYQGIRVFGVWGEGTKSPEGLKGSKTSRTLTYVHGWLSKLWSLLGSLL